MTAQSWREVDLGDVVEFLDFKRRPLNSTERAARKGPYLYYGASGPFDSVDDYLFDGRYLLVAEDGENLSSRKLPVAFFATGKFWVNNHAHIVRGRPGLADDEFLKHWFAGNNISGYITGAAQPKLSQASMRRIRLLLPCYEAQRRIASILSAYDDLIENNTRRIAILEEMARRTYEEWFVRFRFPGHEGVRMVESELGMVPEGWRTDVLAGVCEPKTGIQTGPFGSQLHKADYSEVGVPVLMPKDLIGFRIQEDSVARVPEATAESLKRHRMWPGDIAYGRRGDIGRRAFIMAHQAGWLCGTGCLRIRPDTKKINGWYVFNYLGQEGVVGLIAGRAHGVTMPNLNAQLLESVPVVCPPRELQDQFEQISFPMAELRESLIAKNANLRTTRDLLLPKLISGELDVSALPEPQPLAA
jgi:type I restriction enzyme S subunit